MNTNSARPFANDQKNVTTHLRLDPSTILPLEIMDKIFGYLGVRALLDCRKLNWKYNEICCRTLQDRTNNYPHLYSGLEIHSENKGIICRVHLSSNVAPLPSIRCKFHYVSRRFLRNFVLVENPVHQLFIDFKVESTQKMCIFSHYGIQNFKYLQENDICQIVETFGHHMKDLRIVVSSEDQYNFGLFWKKLDKHLPRIQRLHIKGGKWLNNVLGMYSDTRPMTSLSSLKMLHISSDNFIEIFDFVKHLLLRAAKNVQVVLQSESCTYWHPTFKQDINVNFVGVVIWNLLGSLASLVKMHVDVCSDSASLPTENENSLAEIIRHGLRLQVFSLGQKNRNTVTMNSAAVTWVKAALCSSHESLRRLYVGPVTQQLVEACFPDSIRLPNVDVLDLYLDFRCCAGPIIERFGRMCSNVYYLDLHELDYNVLDVVPIVWKEFTNVKVLKMSIEVDGCSSTHNPTAIDAVFSGLSVTRVREIQLLLASVEDSENDVGQESLLRDAVAASQQGGSILNLHGLYQLELNVFILDRQPTTCRSQIEEFLFMKLLPKSIRQNPKTISVTDAWTQSDGSSTTDDSSNSENSDYGI